MNKNFIFKRVLTLVLAVMMLVTAMPVNLLAEPGGASGSKKPYEIVFDDKSVVRMEDYLNKSDKDGLEVNPAKLKDGQTAAELIKNPPQPDIYTMRADYLVKRGNDYVINYQPYIVSVGADIPKTDKDKILRDIDLPEIDGFTSPTKKFHVDYGFIQTEVKGGKKYGNKGEKTEIPGYGDVYKLNWPFKYEPKKSEIKVVHVFQHLYHKDRYGEEDLSDEEKGDTEEAKKLRAGIKKDIIRSQSGYTGDIININHVEKDEMLGYEPEIYELKTQIPESTEKFVIYVRYNRKHYSVKYNTKEGTEIPNRTLYYEQIIPKLALGEVPTKLGSDFLGWMPSVDLETTDGKTLKANEIIKDSNGNAIVDLYNNIYEKDTNGNFVRNGEKPKAIPAADTIEIKMPASDVTFTAVWKDKPKADYAVQFWAEKADHADNAKLEEKYEYIGTHVYKQKDTGTRPNLDAEPIKGVVLPDLDQTRLQKIWNGATFNKRRNKFIDKFYVYNKDLTRDQNKDPENANLVKSVSSTGQTVYNIYYDRQVYDLYFTKSNALAEKNTFYPEIYGRDQKKNELVKLGGPGELYHYKARFNELMYKWPNDAMQTKGFDEGYQSFGWGPNYASSKWPVHLDTPPYRLNADQFLDMTNYDNWGGYTKHIDKGDGTTIDLDQTDFTTLSFGIKQEKPSIPHHMDFWMDGFKDGETIIRYDLVRTKADTADPQYTHKYPIITGFTPYKSFIKEENQEDGRVNEDRIDGLNDEREEITPYPGNGEAYYNIFGFNSHVGELKFIPAFFSNSDDFGDPLGGDKSGFKENGYLQFHYKRNKYPLRFNYDPLKPKDDSEFNKTNQLDTFYQFPLKVLSPELVDSDLDRDDKEYFKEDPKNFLDNPENLQKLGLTDLVETKNGKLVIKRPEGLADQMEFKGWALDPAGTKLIWANKKETMPSHPVNLYAKWGPPDTKWTVTLDPNGGKLGEVTPEMLTTEKRTIAEGDINDQKINTYPQKEANDGDKQKFTVIHLQKLKELPEPKKDGFDFMGWEFVRYEKDENGKDTSIVDNSYFDTYKVSELYTFGNEVVSNVHLRAIWIKNEIVDVELYHHFLDKDYKEIKGSPEHQTLKGARSGSYLGTVASRQDEEWLLAPDSELEGKGIKAYDDYINLTKDYKAPKSPRTNTYNQFMIVTPEEVDANGHRTKSKENEFHFFYRRFRKREYTVKYIDERAKEELKTATTDADKESIIKKYSIIPDEKVVNGNRHTDARNYRPIPGWKLVSAPQQQLFFDVNEKTNEFLGINGTGADQVFFYYKDVRVIETKKDAPVPDGYVRVTYKADKGGAFTDKDGNSKTELYYDVIKGLKSDLLPEPKELEEGKEKEAGKYYVTPETGKKFIKWDEKPLLNKNTIVDNDTKDFYVFTAKFEWSGLSASGLVRTEAFKDPENKWTNDFAPTIDQLKSQLVWMEKGVKKDLPTGAVIKLYDEAGTELTSDDQVYKLVNEKKAADKDELVRTVNVKAKVTFTDGKDPQELDIPIKVYKNVYEALNKEGDKPLFLKEAEGKDAKDGGLKEILKDNDGNRYIKVTIKPNKDFTNKDDKVYYVNPNAWVEIPNDSNGTAALINWTADKVGQNENNAANGKFDFAKRHKFTEDTVISPRLSQTSELVVHESYKDSKNKWVNNFIDKELTDANLKAAIQVKNDKAKALGDGDTVTIVDDAGEPYADDAALKAALYEKLQEKDDNGKVSRIENIKVKVEYANGEVQKLDISVKVIKNIYEAKTKEGKPDYVPANYVKVTLDPTIKAKDPQKYFYYVNPDAKVLIPGNDPEGVKEDFTGWTMKADSATGAGTSYKLNDRHQFAEDSTIIAQYGQGKVRIKYVDDGGKEIDSKYHIDGVDYPKEKIGKLGDNIPDPANNQDAEKAAAPKFKGYIISDVIVDKKPANYTDPATATITYTYYKKVTADTPSNLNPYFSVIFDANTGEFGSDPKDKKTVYVYFNGNDATVEKVTFKEVREEVEEKYGKPSKANESFLEWQDKAKSGSAVADNYEIQFKGWDWEADPNNGYVPETFYAAYGKASALVKYLDLNGKPIADEFKIDGVEYPTEKAGTADEAIASDVFTATTAPKFTGYKFNRIELNPKDGKYALSNKATIKIYYEKDLDVIPAKDGNGNPNKKPDGYVEVKFVPTANAKDDTEKIFYVNPKKDVTIPIANPEAKATFSFKEWKIGDVTTGTTYNPGTPKKFTDPTTVITATYESSKNIIPYDPSATDPMVRPDGYVRVTFAADKGLTLTEQKAYYVKKNAGIRLADTALVKPAYEAQTGYEFEKWDKEDTLEITTDITVTAKATVLKDVDTVEHPNYVKVTFKADTNGVIKENGNKVDEKVYYVNPTKYVHLTAPTPVGNTGYDFAAWKSDKSQSDFSLANFINYKEDTTITAMFNQKDAVYPKLNGSTKPAGYVEVTFAISGTGGKIADSEVKTYYVDPTRQVSLKAPKTIAGTGYVFDKWRLGTSPSDQIIKPADQRQYTSNTTIYGSFTELKDIIPATNDDGTPNLQPVGYVAVLFIGGDHANKVEGQILYYVNPNVDPAKTIGDLTKPTITPDTGWKQKADPDAWDVQDSTEIKDYTFVVAQYDPIDDVVPALNDDGTSNKKPDGYVTVTFKSGANGKIQEKGSDITEKVYYVNPSVYVKLNAPKTVPDTGFVFGSWKSDKKVFSLDNYIRYEHDTTIIANFNTKNNVIPKINDSVTKPNGFVTVNFVVEKLDDKDAGKIADSETITYFVKKGEAVTIHPPKTEAYTGYEFEKWEPDTTEAKQYTTDTTVKGEFKKLVDIIPSKNPDGTLNAKPEGYVIVNFLKGKHGVLDGRTTFYVNPKAGKTLNNLKPLLNITVVPSPTWKFANWDKPDTTAIDKPLDVTAEYTQLPNIIKAGPKDTAPDGYVVIIFETDGRGTITGNKAYEDKTNPANNETEIVYFVNPKKGVKLADATATASQTVLPVPSTTPDDATKYEFDKWRREIDTTTSITRGRVHIAMFKPKVVKLTYNANGATGTVPAELTVDYDTNVRLAGKGDLAKKDAKFLGWKIGDKTYQAGNQINLKKDTIAYAQWDDDKKIIEYNPVDNPTTRPDDTYVRVTFAVEDGLKLTEQKAYYVKKDANITLGNAELAKPGYEAQTGYKFTKWDKEDSLVITTDITVTAEATKLGTVIPEKDTNGNTNAKPTGYKEVVFKVKDADADKGSLEGVTKFYVNPTEYVTINPPATKANTGFEFGGWDKDTKVPNQYKDDTTITGSFNDLGNAIPKIKPDGSENTKPENYYTVEFEIEKVDDKDPAKFVKGEKLVYFVKPNTEVTIAPPQYIPETGYEFENWIIKPDATTEKVIKPGKENTYRNDTTIYGKFKKLEDIIPEKSGNTTNAKPDGYVKVTFISETNGKLKVGDKKVYYVNPKSKTKLRALKKPDLDPDIGFEEDSWDILGATNYNDNLEISEDMIINAKYKPLADALPKDKATGGENKKPNGYITVTFSAEENGKLTGTSVFYVNPNKAHVLKDKAPKVTPNTGFDFANWDTQIDKRIQYSEGYTIKALYNTKGDVIPQKNTDGTDKPAGYVTVTFDKGTNGKDLTGKTVYYVKPETAVAVTVPAPKVTAQTGYKFKTWDQELTQTFKVDTKITAQYEAIADVVPQENPDGSDKPDGYITITFVKGDHGELSGKTVYYVKPKIAVTLTAPKVTADLGYKFTNWDPALQNIFTSDTIITAKYEAIDDVVPQKNPDGSDKPAGYVSVKFIPTDKAKDTKEKVYYVNPSKEVEITVTPVGTKVKDANGVSYDYTFTGWTVTRGTINSWSVPRVSGKFIQDTEITAKYSVTRGNIMPLPLAKDNAVTAIKDVPKAEDLIKNLYDKNDPDNKNNLPEGTTFKYTDDGKPDVSKPGKTTAKVEVKYPNGKTSIVKVPITVVDNVVEQFGKDKPLVPETYVEVIVDTTNNATDNTKYVKTFWVKPEVEVTIPALAPTGKEITEKDIHGNDVRKTNNFTHWLNDKTNEKYAGIITGTFTRTVKTTTITAQYEFNKNTDPVANNGMYLAQNSTPNAKDFIKNVYDDSTPNSTDNLPPGTKFEFKDGVPDTSTEGIDKTTTIKVTYPNGEVKNVNVKYNVSGDVVEQTDPNYKPNYIPDDYIQVIVTTKETIEKVSVPADPMPQPPSIEEVERADEYTRFARTFWVKPGVEVTLPVKGSKIVGLTDEEDHRQWIFDHWQETGYDTSYGSDDIIGVFYEREKNKPIYIEAKYRKADVPVPSAEYVVTEVGVYPSEQQYRDVITAPKGKDIDKTEVLSRPDVSRPGLTKATIRVTYTDGTQAEVVVMVYVKERNDPRPSEPQIIYRDRIVEKEKIVEKIVKIKDNERLKELRYMQGFNGKFRPYDGLRRSEAAQILANALKADGYAYDPYYPISYTDIGDSWYTEAVRIVSQAGVFQGYSDGTFKPEGKITRAEWVATLRRFQDLKKVSGNDVGLSMGHWATEEIEAAYQAGWLGVYQDGIATFDADKPITRQEVAYVSNKAFDRVLDKAYLKRNVNNMIHYKDINPSMPLYEDILCASNTLLTDGRYYKANAIDMDTLTFNIITDDLLIYQKKFQFFTER